MCSDPLQESTTMRARSIFCQLALICLLLPAAQARDAAQYSTQELVEALTQRMAKLLTKGNAASGPQSDAAIVMLEGKALPLAGKLQSTSGMRVLTEPQLVAEQRAHFLIISQLGMQGPDILIDYETPGNASFGTLRAQSVDGKLVFKSEDTYRSSSGVRARYAKLYGGQPCREGSEMAYAYNQYTRSSTSGKCRAPTFPVSDAITDWY